MAFMPASHSSGNSDGTSPLTRTGCASEAIPPALRILATPSANSAPAVDIAFGRFIQILVKGFADARDVALLHHQLREMRAARHAAAARLGFFQRDIETQFLQPGSQPDVPVTPRGLQFQNPGTEFRQASFIEEISEQMHGLPVEFGGELDAADRIDAGCRGPRGAAWSKPAKVS